MALTLGLESVTYPFTLELEERRPVGQRRGGLWACNVDGQYWRDQQYSLTLTVDDVHVWKPIHHHA